MIGTIFLWENYSEKVMIEALTVNFYLYRCVTGLLKLL